MDWIIAAMSQLIKNHASEALNPEGWFESERELIFSVLKGDAPRSAVNMFLCNVLTEDWLLVISGLSDFRTKFYPYEDVSPLGRFPEELWFSLRIN